MAKWRQHGRVVLIVLDLKSVGPRVQLPFRPLADVVLGSPELTSWVCLSIANWSGILGILNLVMFIEMFIYHCWFTLVLKRPN